MKPSWQPSDASTPDGPPVPGGPVWALVGPTACGKSALAQACAELVGGEIVGCDSVQIYRGFDVGSAKPSLAARRAVPHHLVDSCLPATPFDAMAFARAARTAIADIRSRGKVALLCGGTGLYLRALSHGLVAVASDPDLRQALSQQAAADPQASYARLVQLDPRGAARICATNPAYVVRALEICLLSGRPASEVRAEQAARQAEQGGGLALVVVALDGPSPWLRARIEARSRHIVAAGLLTEVRALLAAGVPADCAPMRSVGYREAAAVLRGELAEKDLASSIAQATWRYARRQRTWLRRSPPAYTLQATAVRDGQQQAVALQDLAAAALKAWRSGVPAGV